MSLIKLVNEKDSRSNALSVIKDVIWGKTKCSKVKDLQFSVFLAVLQAQLSENDRLVVEEMLKKTESENLNENELALVEEVRKYVKEKV